LLAAQPLLAVRARVQKDFRLQFLLESNSNPLTSDVLLLTPPLLSAFPQRLFTFRFASGLPEVLGDLTSLTCVDGCAVVPEAGTLSLALLGLAAYCVRRRSTGRRSTS
jgi:hypothetical protein